MWLNYVLFGFPHEEYLTKESNIVIMFVEYRLWETTYLYNSAQNCATGKSNVEK